MIDYLYSNIFKTTIYIKFSSSKICARHVEKSRVIEDTPILALKALKNGKNRVMGFGKEASISRSIDPSHIRLHNAFSHPRSFVSNFEVAEATLRHLIYLVSQRKMMIRPVIILHPLEKIEGGITHIEYRGLIELGESIGGRKVYIWTGPTLAENQLLDNVFLDNNCLNKSDGTISEI